jgi:circadian clock protein KaiC
MIESEVFFPSTAAKKGTGIGGLDEITGGGLPDVGLTAIIGGPGTGKTVFALQTIFNRMTKHQEPAIFVTFEEPGEQIRRDAASFAWGNRDFDSNQIYILDARLPIDAINSGDFDLSSLLGSLLSIKKDIGARNIVFDGIDVLLSGLPDSRQERRELARLNEWVRQAELFAILTVKSESHTERGQSRSDYIQYNSRCVIALNVDLSQTSLMRSLRVVKYRASAFAADPLPVVINNAGIEAIAFPGVRLSFPTYDDRLSSGIPRLDALLGDGYLRGSSILVSGAPGTSKSSLGASFLVSACAAGKTALLVSFDESASQIISHMRSIGLDLTSHVDSGALVIESYQASNLSPVDHFVSLRALIRARTPDCLVIDPLSALQRRENPFSSMICELVFDLARAHGITMLCTSLLDRVTGDQELSVSHISTLADTWLHVSYLAHEGERNRALTIIKSRGTSHSNQVRELTLSHSGLDLVDVYAAGGKVLMGSARAQRESQDRQDEVVATIEQRHKRFALDRSVADFEAIARKAAEDLDWKRREVAVMEENEKARLASEKDAAAARVQLRRGTDDPTLTHGAGTS